MSVFNSISLVERIIFNGYNEVSIVFGNTDMFQCAPQLPCGVIHMSITLGKYGLMNYNRTLRRRF